MKTTGLWIAATACTLTLGAGALAQPGSAVPARAAMPTAAEAQTLEPARLTVEFSGGPVSAYVELLRRSAPAGTTNIVVSAAAARVILAPISLRDVSVANAVFAMRTAAGTDEGVLQVNVTGFQRSEPQAAQRDSLFEVDYARHRGPLGTPQQARVTEPTSQLGVYSLRPVLNEAAGTVDLQYSPLLTAVQTAIDLAPASEPAEVRFHAETALLMVRGSIEQLRAAEACVEQIGRDLKARRAAAEEAFRPEMMLAELRAEVAEADLEWRVAHVRMNENRARQQIEEDLVNANLPAPRHNPEAEAAQQRFALEVEKAALQRQLAAEKLAMAERRLGGGEPVALVVDCAGWAPSVYAEVAALAESVYKGAPAPKVTRGEGQTLHVHGPRGRVQVLVQVVQEAAHARGVAAPHVRPAGDGR